MFVLLIVIMHLQKISSLSNEFPAIPAQRQAVLCRLGDYLTAKERAGETARVVVICTHNSRRSHMGQLWLMAAAAHYGLHHVQAFSGGTEATAFNPRAVAAMRRAGFRIDMLGDGGNPTYRAAWDDAHDPILMWSKRFDEAVPPGLPFAAVMVCSEADEACPVVPGADARFSLPFNDPKHFDGTPLETEKYDEACHLIARDFAFAVHHAAKSLQHE